MLCFAQSGFSWALGGMAAGIVFVLAWIIYMIVQRIRKGKYHAL